jgi:hypothetical protein
MYVKRLIIIKHENKKGIELKEILLDFLKYFLC